ncbi:uncharacterized protein LOC135849605 [Planococcus citri]|uniref:uncharacterized protein LOC135849605 n=1 Tax=Planococcus citri TaxID=170843 RepID=UPI0031F8C583
MEFRSTNSLILWKEIPFILPVWKPQITVSATLLLSVDLAASSVQKGNLIAFKRAHQIPQGLISNIQIRTYRNYSTDSGNRTSSNRVEDRLKVFKDMLQEILNENDLSKRSELGANLLLKIKELVYAIESYEDKADQELKAAENKLYFVKCCAAIEKFELDYGKSAVLDYVPVAELAHLSCLEQGTILRANLLEWIFENRSEEDRVKTLLELVNDSKEFDSLGVFCRCIAVMHEDLSKTIRGATLTLGFHPKATKALSIFMSVLENNDSVVVKK